jgi:DNA polymerase V
MDSISDFLKKTSIGNVWGIGRQTTVFLNKKGIRMAQDFVDKNIEWVRENLAEPYEMLWQELRGISLNPIDPKPKTEYSSIQKTRSFHPATNDLTFLLSQLSKHIEDACTKARHYKLVPKKLSLFLKTRHFQYISRSLTLSTPTNAPEILLTLAEAQLKEMHTKGTLYRTVGVTLHGLTPSGAAQTDLFGGTDKAHKFEIIHDQIDSLENKYGKHLVYLASTHKARSRKEKGTDADDLDRDLLFL